jgi:hypothetical protein
MIDSIARLREARQDLPPLRAADARTCPAAAKRIVDRQGTRAMDEPFGDGRGVPPEITQRVHLERGMHFASISKSNRRHHGNDAAE